MYGTYAVTTLGSGQTQPENSPPHFLLVVPCIAPGYAVKLPGKLLEKTNSSGPPGDSDVKV